MKLDRMLIEGAIYAVGCLFALWKGGRSEGLVAGAMLLEFAVSFTFRPRDGIENPHYIHLLLDLGVLAAVLYVAFSTSLGWAVAGCALQILSVLSYITRIIDPSIHSWAYVTVSIALGYGLMLTIIYGAVRHQQMLSRRTKIPSSGSQTG